MRLKAVSIPDVPFIDSKVYSDDREFFFESFNQSDFEKVTGFSLFFTQAYFVISSSAEVFYKTTNDYTPKYEYCIC
tara:strand:- start:287 stop:514 length:228 start_codon:yes stop_codon:yes gene_type:complete